MKTWLQVSFNLDEPLIGRVEETLEALGALSISLSDRGDSSILEPLPGSIPCWPELRVTALLNPDADREKIAREISAAAGTADPVPLDFTVVEDRDWLAEWRSELEPKQFGDRLWVCPRPDAAVPQDRATVLLEPGLAFGTGAHPTTALCLEWLDGLELNNRTVLDYGCGSGILAVAALALGALRATCTDIDEQALTSCRNNARRNRCLGDITIVEPAAIPSSPRCDVLVANILSGALIGLAPELGQYCNRGADVALSGILAGQARQVCDAFRDWVSLRVTGQTDDWVLLTGTTAR